MHSFELMRWVNATLHNDEVSTDEELLEYFRKGGLTIQEAKKAIIQRNKCLNDTRYKVEI